MKSEKTSAGPGRHWPLAAGLLAVLLAILFFKSFLPGYVHFSNDGPLGQQSPTWMQLPGTLTGGWDDINYIGFNAGAAPLSVNSVLHYLLLSPVGYSKFYAPIALFILGFGAWTFFTQLRLTRAAALIGGLVVPLTALYFSAACWGVASQQIAAGFVFMALALVVSITPTMPPLIRWARIILAGLAVGVNIMEAADIGALYSLVVAGFTCYHAWTATAGGPVRKVSRGVTRVVVIAASAAFIASFAIHNVIGTQIKGIVGTQQDEATKQAHWDFATQWSFPKRETLAFVIPGLFGYRMDAPDGANYWGVGGRDPVWWRYLENGRQGPPPEPGRFMRQSGGGCYLGVTAVLLALWAAFQSVRKNSVFTPTERKLVWFWAAAMVLALPFAYGRYAPFFKFVYALPYASTIRNPGKFLTIFIMSMTVLTAYGVHGLCRSCLEIPYSGPSDWGARLKNWWGKASPFDRRWTTGCLAAIVLGLIGWFIYWRSEPALAQYLTTVQFDETLAPKIADFSVRQVGWFLLFLTFGTGLFSLILSGAFAGRHAKTGLFLLGLLVVGDLVLADLPWVKFIYYPEKYSDNAILEKLRDKPYEHRVAILPFRAPPEYELFQGQGGIYRIEWAQHTFPYYNIQSLDIIQMARMPEDLAAFETALQGDGTTNTIYKICRRWELTNTRYLLGAAGFLDVLNQQLDPGKQRFRIATTFDIVPKPGITYPSSYEDLTAVINPGGAGKYALFDFAGALPRAKLYSNWLVRTNDEAALAMMSAENFDPAKTVIVTEPIPAATGASATNLNSASATYESYAPKDIKLKTQSDTATVLLLNDKYDPNWQVWVDGKRADLLHCNYLMRGVQVPSGAHTVEFLFKPDVTTLYVSVAAIVLGIGLAGVVAFHAKSQRGN